MKNTTKFLAFAMGFALLAFGCSGVQKPVEPEVPGFIETADLAIPDGATLVSATFYIYAHYISGQTVTVHRITAPWDESVVTYANFGNAYDPAVWGSFTVTAAGYQSADITLLVQSWLDGTYDNYGILLMQGVTPYTYYASSEIGDVNMRPALEICYSLGGTQCVTIKRGVYGEVQDAFILETVPNFNSGDGTELYTGLVYDSEKFSLLQFDLLLAAIGDTVWIDENRNGIQDAGEPGMPDVTVNLYDCQDSLIATTTTDGDGFYIFDNLAPGDYYVEFIAPEGYDITLQDQGSDDAVDSDADPATGLTICTTLDAGEYDPTWDCGLYLMEQEGCTLTIGFWKTHAGFGPQANVVSQYLPIWLGNAGGSESINVADSVIAHDILMRNVYGRNSNGITKLYAQLLGSKLNIAAGADDTDVAAVIAAADDFLADHYYTDWNSLNKPTKHMVLGWMSDLDDYNNGITGPGHCD
ncbi:MAG: DNRLRE domain-containing protein [Candidatus Zixiibacteriota bacterium]|nr:MAG: DNRLRE domain-containing protein [candidate division Zixibacteria bacterium]